MTHATVYWHGPLRVHDLACDVVAGLKARGIDAQLRKVDDLVHGKPTGATHVFMYGLGPAMPVFKAYEGRATRFVFDRGYFDEYLAGKRKYYRVSVNDQQPTAHLRNVAHPSSRWACMGIAVQPVLQRGMYVLVCGMGPKQARLSGYAYGQWEVETVARLRQLTKRPIIVREKPGNPVIPNVPRDPSRKPSDAIRGAWCVVCNTGNIGADCIVEGVPVIQTSGRGPAAPYYPTALEAVDGIVPLTPAQRLAALADIAHFNWSAAEIKSGAFASWMKVEGFL